MWHLKYRIRLTANSFIQIGFGNTSCLLLLMYC
jgi:hypothetical protein